MTKREGAVLTAYTGTLLVDFSSFHKYAEEILGRPIFTHEMASKELMKELKEASTDEFTDIMENQTEATG